jgi:hypothetical protein
MKQDRSLKPTRCDCRLPALANKRQSAFKAEHDAVAYPGEVRAGAGDAQRGKSAGGIYLARKRTSLTRSGTNKSGVKQEPEDNLAPAQTGLR